MKTSEKLKSVLCDGDGLVCIGNEEDNVTGDNALEELEKMEEFIDRVADTKCNCIHQGYSECDRCLARQLKREIDGL